MERTEIRMEAMETPLALFQGGIERNDVGQIACVEDAASARIVVHVIDPDERLVDREGVGEIVAKGGKTEISGFEVSEFRAAVR